MPRSQFAELQATGIGGESYAVNIRSPERRFEDEPPRPASRPTSRPRTEPRHSPHARVKREEEALASVQAILKSKPLPPSASSASVKSPSARPPTAPTQGSSTFPPRPQQPPRPPAAIVSETGPRPPPRKKMNLQEYRAKFGTPKGSGQQQHASNLFIPRNPRQVQ